MVAHKCKTYNPNRLEKPRANHRKTFRWVAPEIGRYMRPLDEHRCNDDEHAEQCKTGSMRKLVYVTIERQWVGNTGGAQYDDELAVGE